MNNAVYHTPDPTNEPVRAYAPGSTKRTSLQRALESLKEEPINIPAFIGGEAVTTGTTTEVVAPHEHERVLAHLHQCGPDETEQAIEAALAAKAEWAGMDWTDRAAIFLRAADLLAGPWRDRVNAATMLGQSKSAHQAEIDAACELIDFFRFNVRYMEEIYTDQPNNAPGTWNHLQYRPLEGFVLAVTPFNFTSIQGNLPTAPALMGNTVLWKPSSTSAFSAYYIYKLLEEAGLPPGVINMLPADDGAQVGNTALASAHFAGSTLPGRKQPSSISGRKSARTSTRTAPFPRSWARQAARTSSSRIPRQTPKPSSPPSCGGALSIRGRSARRLRASTSPSRNGNRCKISFSGNSGS